MSLSIDVLADAMFDGGVVYAEPCNAFVGRVFVGVDGCAIGNGVADKALQGRPVGTLRYGDLDLASFAVFGSGDSGLANRTASAVEFLMLMLVGFLAADVGFVNLYRASELVSLYVP